MRRCPGDVRAWRLQPPLGVVADQFVLEPLDPQHDAQDHEAWSSSIEHIDDAGFPDGRWPRVMTLDENRADLERHARDFAARSGFTSTVIGPSDRRVIGCVYIYPAPTVCTTRSWPRGCVPLTPAAMLRSERSFPAELVDAWPFERISYAGPAQPLGQPRLTRPPSEASSDGGGRRRGLWVTRATTIGGRGGSDGVMR